MISKYSGITSSPSVLVAFSLAHSVPLMWDVCDKEASKYSLARVELQVLLYPFLLSLEKSAVIENSCHAFYGLIVKHFVSALCIRQVKLFNSLSFWWILFPIFKLHFNTLKFSLIEFLSCETWFGSLLRWIM